MAGTSLPLTSGVPQLTKTSLCLHPCPHPLPAPTHQPTRVHPWPPPLPQGYLASSAVTSIQPTTNVTADGSFVMVVSPDQPADLAEPGVNWVRHSFEGHPIFLVSTEC